MSYSAPATGNTELTQPENRAFYPALDGLRAIAFMMVFGQHYCAVPWGWTGVNVFFVLSGFLITGILFDSRDDPYRVRNFYVRRTLRIFPLYYGIFLALLLLHPIMHWRWSIGWIAWPLYVGNFLRFTSRATTVDQSPQEMAADAHLYSSRLPGQTLYLGHFWSLCVEEQFYLVWPWIVFWIRSRRALIWICGVVVVVVPLLRAVVQQTAPQWMLDSEVLYRVTVFQLDSLLLGGLVSLLWRGAHRERLLKMARVVACLCAIGAIVYLAKTAHISEPHWRTHYHYPTWRLTWGLTFVNVFSASIVVCILRPAGMLYRFLSLAVLRWIGRISYGAYILHDMFHLTYEHLIDVFCGYMTHRHPGRVSIFLRQHEIGFTIFFSLAASLLLAWLSFRFFEAPFLNLKERWTIRGKRPITA